LILTLAGALPLAAQSPSRHELRGPEVAIHNLAGTVQIEGGSGDAVQVEVVPGGADAGDLEAHADLRIRVPAGRALELHLAVGRVSAANVNGRLRIRTAAAPVTVTGGGGDLHVSTASGDVRLADIQSTDVTVETGSGGVTLELGSGVHVLEVETGSGDVAITAPAEIGAQLSIETGSGDIESDFPVSVARSGRHHLSGAIGDGKGRVRVETGSGSVRLLRAKA
ncbi:MAG TPA: DUF4097 family beta strand repeat-containing protein, partial [Gemmatimonadales bacterium]|nr:DUF4097 family beta strand repeat-containing protein [Gemmatimonadales bacterium]